MAKEEFTIEIDCPPGGIRPDDLLPGVLEGLGLNINPQKTSVRFFGNYEWIIPEDQHEQYKKVQPQVKERITALYHKGIIRYGSW
jgi:hypothetical protein